MSGQREATKQHYDLHAQQQLPTSLALKARREGPAAPLKSFHNEIKRRLIYRFAYQAPALLDYACGRGGDLHKWRAAKVQYVKGLDLSPQEVAEAERRCEEMLRKFPGCGLHAEFQQIDTLGLQVYEEGRQYDAATCMFALHYFFDKEDSLKCMMQTVAANLKPGGFFIGCVPDGKRIKAHLQKHSGLLQLPHLVLKQVSPDTKAPFGSSYIMEIPDTVVEGHEGITEGSHEYLVFEKVLLAQAKAHGLQPVVDLADPALDELFEEGDKGKPMKHFNPHYPDTTDSSLALASRLYTAFVLQKVEQPDQVCLPPLPPVEGRDAGGRHPPRWQQQQQQQRTRSPRRSPTHAERLAELEQAAAPPGWEQQQLPQPPPQPPPQQPWQLRPGGYGGGGGKNRLNSVDWQLPYAPCVLPELPCAYLNMRQNHLQRRNAVGRFVITPPPLPYYAGPVQYSSTEYGIMQPHHQRLPSGQEVRSYYDELNYHATLDQEQQQQQQQQHLPPPPAHQPPPQHQQQQQQQQGPPVGQQYGRPGGGPAHQPPGLPNALPPPPPPVSELCNTPTPPPPDVGEGGRQQAPVAPASEAAAGAGADAGGGAGGGRGTKRGRKQQEDQDGGPDAANATDAAAAAAAGSGAGVAADDGAAALDEGRPPPPKLQAAAAPAAAKPFKMTGRQPDPLGYKTTPAPVLAPEALEAFMQHAVPYADS